MGEQENKIKNINHDPSKMHTRQIQRGWKLKKKRERQRQRKEEGGKNIIFPSGQNRVIHLVLAVFWSVC